MVALSLALIPQPGIEETGWRVSFSDCEKVTNSRQILQQKQK